MRPITKFVHRFVYITRSEFLFLWLSNLHSSFLKFLPLHFEYKQSQKRKVKRDNVVFDLVLSDYMQWHIFAKQPDFSWREAINFIDNNSCMLDIGANSGAFALRVAHQASRIECQDFRVYAFEPNPYVFQKLEQNLSANPRLIPYVRLEQIGLGNELGSFGMTFDKENSGHGHITENMAEVTLQIHVDTVDSFVSEQVQQPISFLKIDVEGFEPFVLEGAQQTISAHKPALFVEITEKWFRERNYSQTIIFDYLFSLNYRLYAEEEKGWVEINENSTVFSNHQFNMLAIHG